MTLQCLMACTSHYSACHSHSFAPRIFLFTGSVSCRTSLNKAALCYKMPLSVSLVPLDLSL